MPSWPASCAAGCATSRSQRCCAYANACGALVVSRHGCAPAMPSWIELQHFLAHGSRDARGCATTPTLEHLHRVTTRAARLARARRPRLRPSRPVRGARARDGADAGAHRRARSSASLASSGSSPPAASAARARSTGFGVIVDGRYGEDVLPTLTGSGWLDRAAGRAAGLAAARLRGRRRRRAGAARLADRARRQVPGQLPSRRRRGAARGAARSGSARCRRRASPPTTSCWSK